MRGGETNPWHRSLFNGATCSRAETDDKTEWTSGDDAASRFRALQSVRPMEASYGPRERRRSVSELRIQFESIIHSRSMVMFRVRESRSSFRARIDHRNREVSLLPVTFSGSIVGSRGFETNHSAVSNSTILGRSSRQQRLIQWIAIPRDSCSATSTFHAYVSLIYSGSTWLVLGFNRALHDRPRRRD